MAIRRIFVIGENHTIDPHELTELTTKGVEIFIFNKFTAPAFKDWIASLREVAMDIETPHWDEKMVAGRMHLASWADANRVITFDHHSIDPKLIYDTNTFKKTTVVIHNAKFEEHWFMEHGIEFPRVHCTFITEQKLLQGSGLFHNLPDVLTRRGIQHTMNKDVRKEFADPAYTHKHYHVIYNQDDVVNLLELKRKQDLAIDHFNLGFHIRQIHFPLIRVLVKMEREGLIVNNPKFAALADKALAEMRRIEGTLNTWLAQTYPGKDFQQLNKPVWTRIQQLRLMLSKLNEREVKTSALLQKYKQENKTHLKACAVAYQSLTKIAQDRLDRQAELIDLEQQKTISWTSTDQVIALLQELGCSPMPKARDKKTRQFKPSLARAARERWMLNNLDHPLKFIIKQFDEYQGQVKHVSSFGHEFLKKYKHPVTGKWHTSYKQGTVETGRLASGDSDSEPPTFNSQQIPADQELRECFGTDPGYDIATCDLSAAELVTLCSLANDQKLLALYKQGDLHSYFANKGWSAIYTHRGVAWTSDLVISKHQNSDKRTDYKPMMFGTVYGLKAPKAAETLNCSEREGAIAIDTIISEIPDSIKMVEDATYFALTNGYIIHNTRTNSRRWFTPVIESLKTGEELQYMDRADVTGASRNTRIQGTQADMLCEAMVTLQRYLDFWKIDAQILMQVHDEMVVKFRKELTWFPERLREIMKRVANKYLRPGITMDAEVHVKSTWTKPK